MPPPKKKPKPAAKPGRKLRDAEQPHRSQAMTENRPQQHTPAPGGAMPEELAYPAGRETSKLTPVEVDPAAEAKKQDELNARIARETKAPFTVPELPAGLSPNQKIQMATGSGQHGVTYAPVTAEDNEHDNDDDQT